MNKTLIQTEYKPLSHEEQDELILQIQNGDCSKMDDLIKCNHAFLVRMASKYAKGDYSMEDAYQDACVGMINAVKTYKPNSGCKFIVWSINYISNVCHIGYLNYYKISVPKNNNYYYTLMGSKTYLNESVISKLSDVSVSNISDIETKRDSVLDICDNRYVANDFDNAELINILLKSIDELNVIDRDKQMILYLNGLVDGERKTLQETGELFGVSRERVRQVNAKCCRMLRFALKKKDINLSIL